MKNSNIGKQIKTHKQLQDMVKNKRWIVFKVKIGDKVYTPKSYVAAAFVNRRYVEVCEYLSKGYLYEYVKNK